MFTPEEKRKMMEDHVEKALAAPRVKRVDKTALSYWFPLIEAAGVPVPKTTIIPMSKEAQESVWNAFDGKLDGDVSAFTEFCRQIEAAGAKMGYPFFLRTDHTSGKHSWERTCFVPSTGGVARHIFALAEFSELAGFPGMPWDVFVVREFLPIMPAGHCPRYGHMPVNREFRYFVDDGVIRCRHPYWPDYAIEDGGLRLPQAEYEKLCQFPGKDDEDFVDHLARQAGYAVGGSWSIDILETKRGWYVTDMAEADKSWHWPECSA